MVKAHDKYSCLLIVVLFSCVAVQTTNCETKLTITVPKDRIVSGEPLAFELSLEMNAETEPPFPKV